MSPYRAIIVRFANDPAHRALERVMKEHPFEHVCSIGSHELVFAPIAREDQYWINSSDVRGGEYKGLNETELLPLDEELIDAMRPCESIFMTLVMRLEFARKFSFDERKRMYYLHLRYWNDYIERYGINLFLAGIMPHEIPDYVIYELCKLKGIPTYMFHASTVRDCAFLEEDWEVSATQVKERYEQLLAAGGEVTLSDKFEDYYQRQINPEGTPPIDFKRLNVFERILHTFRTQTLQSLAWFCKWLPTLLSWKIWCRRYAKTCVWLRRRKLQRAYDLLAREPDLKKKFIYVPLHFQPECSTCPMAGAYVDQLLEVQLLSACVPDDVLLYVKEHPRQYKKGIIGRDISFYEGLSALPNVHVVPIDCSSFALRESSMAVATGTGTAGFEALFREKPVFMFGHRYYQYAPGVFSIESEEDCRVAMQAVFAEGQKPDLNKLRVFLKAMEETCVETSVNRWHQEQASDLTPEQHTESISQAILEQLS